MFLNIKKAKAKLSQIIEKVLQGEEVIIVKRNKPLVRLKSLMIAKEPRKLGEGKSYILAISEDFDAPLDFVG